MPRVKKPWAAIGGPLKGAPGMGEVNENQQARCLHHKRLTLTLALFQGDRGLSLIHPGSTYNRSPIPRIGTPGSCWWATLRFEPTLRLAKISPSPSSHFNPWRGGRPRRAAWSIYNAPLQGFPHSQRERGLFVIHPGSSCWWATLRFEPTLRLPGSLFRKSSPRKRGFRGGFPEATLYLNTERSSGCIRDLSRGGNAKRFPLPLGEGQGEESPERANIIFSRQSNTSLPENDERPRGAAYRTNRHRLIPFTCFFGKFYF